jgi:hypothetical protein
MKDPYTKGQARMLMQNRKGFQDAQKQAEQRAGKKYGVKPGSMGVNAQAAQKELENPHSAEGFLRQQNNAGVSNSQMGIPQNSTDPTGDLYKMAAQNTANLQQQFHDQAMADNVRDQLKAQEYADAYTRKGQMQRG